MKKIVAFLILVCGTLTFSTNASARSFCAERQNIVQILSDKHSETQSAFGLTLSGTQLLELFTSSSGNWTILLTKKDGITCAMASGKNWTSPKFTPTTQTRE